MICRRCPDHPTRTPSPDGTHTCPSCGSSVYLRDAGYQRFTEMPLPMPAIVRERLLYVPFVPEPEVTDPRAIVCEHSKSGPGCGKKFVPSKPNRWRCPACSHSKRWGAKSLQRAAALSENPPAVLPRKTPEFRPVRCTCGQVFTPIHARVTRLCPECVATAKRVRAEARRLEDWGEAV